MTQDLLYYDSGYVDSNYFVYTADAQSLEAGTFSMSATVGVIKHAGATLTSQFTQTAVISDIRGIDMFAMSNASLAAAASRIRNNNVSVTSAFTQVVSGSKFIHFGSDQNANATIVVDNLRVRYTEAAANAAFSLTADCEVIKGGVTREAEAYLTSTFTQVTNINRVRDASSNQESNSSLSANGIRNQYFNAELSSTAIVQAQVGKIVQFAAAEYAAFTPNITCSITKNSFAVLDSTATLSATAKANKTLSSAQSSAFSQTTNIIRNRYTSSDLTSTASLTAQATKISDKFYTVIKDIPDAGGNSSFAAIDFYVDSSKNIYTIGTTKYSTSTYYISKQDQYGNLQWVKTFLPSSSNSPRRLLVDSTGNFYLCGMYFGSKISAFITKYNSSGVIQWNKTFSESGYDYYYRDAAIDSSDNIYITGDDYYWNKSVTTKINSSGVIQWSKSGLGGMHISISGSYIYLTSTTLVSKVDLSGTYQWSRSIASSGPSNPSDSKSIIDSSNNVYSTVTYTIASTTYSSILKYDSTGTLQWQKSTISDGGVIELSTNGTDIYFTGLGKIGQLNPSTGDVIWVKSLSIQKLIPSSALYGLSSDYISSSPMDYEAVIYKLFLDGSGIIENRSYAFTTLPYESQALTITSNAFPSVSNVSISSATLSGTAGTSTPTVTRFTVTSGGALVTGTAGLTSAATVTTTATNIKKSAVTLSSAAIITAQVNANKKATANLTSAATMTTQATGFIKASANLQANGFVVAVNGRIRPEVAGLDSAFTLTANLTRIKQYSVALQSTATLTANALDLDLAQVALTSRFTQVSNPIKTSRISKNLTSAFTLSGTTKILPGSQTSNIKSLLHLSNNLYDSAQNITATGSTGAGYLTPTGVFSSTNFGTVLKDPQNINPTDSGTNIGSDDFSFDIRFIPYENVDFSTYYRSGILARFSGTSGIYDLMYVSTSTTFGIRFRQHSGNVLSYTNLLTYNGSASYGYLPYTTYAPPWKHVKLVKYNNNIYLLVDGILISSTGLTETFNNYYRLAVSETVITTPAPFYGFIDEATLRVGNIDAPTDYNVPLYPYALGTTWLGYSYPTSTATMVINAGRKSYLSSSMSSSASVTANDTRVRFFNSSMTSAASMSITATKVTNLQVNLQSTALTVVNPVKKVVVQDSMLTTATVNANNTRVKFNTAALQSTATVNNSSVKTARITLNLQSTATVTCTALRIKQLNSQLNAFATELNIVNKIGRGFIHMDSTATVNAQVRKVTDSPQYLHAVATLTARGINTQFGRAAMQATATVVANVDKIKRVEVHATSTATVTCRLTAIRRTNSTQAAQFIQQTATYNSKITRITASLTSTATVITRNQIVRLAQAHLQVNAEIPTIYVGVLSRAEAHLVCEGFQLTAGKVINIDPYYQLRIKQETRGLIIYEETRKIRIKGETRVNIIQGKIL